MASPLYIFGASGHGKVVHSVAKALGYTVLGFVDDDPTKAHFDGLPVKSLDDLHGAISVFVAIGNAKSRLLISEKITKRGFNIPALVHPQAHVDESVEVGTGAVVMAGAIVAVGSRIGRGAIVNHGSVLDHDCILGDFAHLCPGASVAGGVSIGPGSWIGIGSTVIQGIIIGKSVLVAAGAVVIRDVSDSLKVRGVPAKPF